MRGREKERALSFTPKNGRAGCNRLTRELTGRIPRNGATSIYDLTFRQYRVTALDRTLFFNVRWIFYS